MASELNDDLRTVADAIIDDAERLKGIEEEKSRLDASDPRSRELTTESTRIVARLGVGAQVQEDLTREAAEAPEEGPGGST